jgi:hypothetical protein
VAFSLSKVIPPVSSAQLRERVAALQTDLPALDAAAARVALDYAQDPGNDALAKIAGDAFTAARTKRDHIEILSSQIPAAVAREHQAEAERLVAEEGAKRRAKADALGSGGGRLLALAHDYDHRLGQLAKEHAAFAAQLAKLGLRLPDAYPETIPNSRLLEPLPISRIAEAVLQKARDALAAQPDYTLEQAIADLDWEMRRRATVPAAAPRRVEPEMSFDAAGRPIDLNSPQLPPGMKRGSVLDPGNHQLAAPPSGFPSPQDRDRASRHNTPERDLPFVPDAPRPVRLQHREGAVRHHPGHRCGDVGVSFDVFTGRPLWDWSAARPRFSQGDPAAARTGQQQNRPELTASDKATLAKARLDYLAAGNALIKARNDVCAPDEIRALRIGAATLQARIAKRALGNQE